MLRRRLRLVLVSRIERSSDTIAVAVAVAVVVFVHRLVVDISIRNAGVGGVIGAPFIVFLTSGLLLAYVFLIELHLVYSTLARLETCVFSMVTLLNLSPLLYTCRVVRIIDDDCGND